MSPRRFCLRTHMICASALRLYFKGGDERVFRVDDDMFGFALELQSDSELQGALLAHFSLPRLFCYRS